MGLKQKSRRIVASVNSENIPIPTGFYAVAGTSKDTGFVISSESEDDLNNSKGGNQFVWVPVDKNQKLKLEVSSPEDIVAIKLTDPAGDEISLEISGTIGETYTNSNIIPTYNGEYSVEVTAGENKKETLVVRNLYATDKFNSNNSNTLKNYNDLKQEDGKTLYSNSVNFNGGFYIGRYETGVSGSNYVSGDNNASVDDLIDKYGIPVSKLNMYVYNNITKSQAQGLAKKMYEGKSDLITGAAWDRTPEWLIETKNKTEEQVINGVEWGNNPENLIKTGTPNQTKSNNIYMIYMGMH